jgi:hypothetical protein
MKAKFFTYAEKPKAVYFLSDIKKEVYPNHSNDDFYKEVFDKWVSNNDVVIIDDRQNSYSSETFQIDEIEKYLDKLEELKKEFKIEDEDEDFKF